MSARRWLRRRPLSVCGGTALATYTLLTLVFYRRQPHENSPLSGRPAACRPDMRVNELPPLSDDDLVMLRDLFTYLSRPHAAACHKVARFGGKSILRKPDRVPILDGQKFVCLDPEFTLHTTDNCIVYSFGISSDWSFDWEMEGFGCSVFAFDPSINVTDDLRDGTITFLSYGIGDRDRVGSNAWQVRTLDTFVDHLNHSRSTIHYLKMDVEFAEWEVLRQQAIRWRSSALFRNVQQLGVELHFTQFLPVLLHASFYREAYKTLLVLQKMGFYPFSYEANLSLEPDVEVPGLPEKLVSAMEVVWLKTGCVSRRGIRYLP